MTYEDAQEEVRTQDDAAAIRMLEQRRLEARRARDRATKSKQAFERCIALAVSSAPERADWYAHPGRLRREVVLEAAKVSSLQLDSIMDRFRRASTTRKPKGR